MTKQRLASQEIHLVAFEIIERCNLYCSFCVRNAHNGLVAKVDTALFTSRLAAVGKAFSGLEAIALTGGEPFLHPEIIELVKLARSQWPAVSITTNGTVARDDVLEALARIAGVSLIISIDGPNADVHDLVRGKAGSFARSVEFARRCTELHLPLLVNVTVCESNARAVYETVELACELGAVDVSVALVKPLGRGRPLVDDEVLLVEVARQVLLAQRDLGHLLTVRFTDPLAHIFDVSMESGGRRGCGADSGTIHIQCDGSVLLCTSCAYSVGNIDEMGEKVGKRLNDDHPKRRIGERLDLGGACGACVHREICGGCRCRAAADGDMLGGDPLCPKNRYVVSDIVVEETLRRAEERLSLAHAQDPVRLRRWLEEWQLGEKFSREDPNFFAQRRWGHTTEFGDGVVVHGEMGRRHEVLLRRLVASGSLPLDLRGARILDVGPWTGGEAFLLAALGATVDVFEESIHGREVIQYLCEQYDLPVVVRGGSFYELSRSSSKAQYDYAVFFGVISHVSDPVVGLRILFEQLRDGGTCFVETQTSYREDGADEFWGLGRQGWVWWNVGRLTLLELLRCVGFSRTRVLDFDVNRRILLSTERAMWQDMPMRSGLSSPVGVRIALDADR